MQAAYVFEDFAEKWADLPCLSKSELLYATARVALVHAPMALPVLRKVLFLGLKDNDLGVLDAARLVYSAFQAGLDTAKGLLTCATTAQPAADSSTDTVLAELTREFNTLAVIYEQPARTFVDATAHKLRDIPVAAPDDAAGDDADVAEGDFMEESAEAQLLDLSFGEDESDAGAAVSASGARDASGAGDAAFAHDDFFGDLGGASNGSSTQGAAAGTQADAAAGGSMRHTMQPQSAEQASGGLEAEPTIGKDAFAEEWAALEGASQRIELGLPGDKVMALMTQEPRPFSGVHAAVAGEHVKVRLHWLQHCCLTAQICTQCARAPAFSSTQHMLAWGGLSAAGAD